MKWNTIKGLEAWEKVCAEAKADASVVAADLAAQSALAAWKNATAVADAAGFNASRNRTDETVAAQTAAFDADDAAKAAWGEASRVATSAWVAVMCRLVSRDNLRALHARRAA